MIEVAPGDHIPYVYKGRAFYRNPSTTSVMSQHFYEQLLIRRGHFRYAWEELYVNEGYDINLLNQDEIYKTISEGVRANRIPAAALKEEVESLLVRLGLFREGRLINAAVVLFGKDHFPNYSQCLIKMGCFDGLDKFSNFLDNQQIHGNVFDILNEASNFMMRHLSIRGLLPEDRFERIDAPVLPVLAVREALINAISHKDYSDRASHITLAIYKDRLELWNYGGLPPQLSIKDLREKHHSYPRNKIISQVLYNRGLVEKWGTGIEKMIKICKKEGMPEPEFSEYSGGFSVTFKFGEIRKKVVKDIIESKLNIRQEKVLSIIKKEGLVRVKAILDILEEDISIRTLQVELSRLKEMGLVESRGKGKAAVWVAK